MPSETIVPVATKAASLRACAECRRPFEHPSESMTHRGRKICRDAGACMNRVALGLGRRGTRGGSR